MMSRALARPSLPRRPGPEQADGPAAQIGREGRAWTSQLLNWWMRDTAPVPEWTQGRPRLDELGWGFGRNRDRHAVSPAPPSHPGTNQISTIPSTAETMPAIRSDV